VEYIMAITATQIQADIAAVQTALNTLNTDFAAFIAAPVPPPVVTPPPPTSSTTLVVDVTLAGSDATSQIQSLINTAAMKATSTAPYIVRVPAASKPYLINPTFHGEYGLILASNVTLQIDSGATLGTVTTPSSLQTYYTVYFPAGVTNAHVTGGGSVVGDRASKSSPSEWGMGIGADACTNCSIEGTGDGKTTGLTISGCCGDGIYIGPGAPAHTFVVTGVISNGNRRQGMTIDSVNGLHVFASSFINTNGTSPACGIDIEPDQSTQSVSNVLIEQCTITGNLGGGIQSGPDDTGPGVVNGVMIQNNDINNNGTSGGIYGGLSSWGGVESQNSANVVIQNNRINSNKGPAVTVRSTRNGTVKVLSNTGTGNAAGVSNSAGSSCTVSGNTFS
jgi:hypothetical protein